MAGQRSGPSAEIHRTIKLGEPPDFSGTGVPFSPDAISGTAVLEYGATEILPPVGAILKLLRVSADPVAKPAAHTCAESRGLDPRKQLRERDGLSAGGSRIRTIGSA